MIIISCDQKSFNNYHGNYNLDEDFTFYFFGSLTEENLLGIGVNKYDEDTVKQYDNGFFDKAKIKSIANNCGQ